MDNKSQDNREEGKILDHEYDGIKEYDNPLPGWWLITFFATIIFSFNYFMHYTFGGGQTQQQELEADLRILPKAMEKNWNESELIGKIDQPETLMNGKIVFNSKCASCHGNSGEGIIGPNLTDNFWIQGEGHRKDIIQIIGKGVVEKGMPAWREMISENELLAVTGYVFSLKGKNPPNSKAPQGQEIIN